MSLVGRFRRRGDEISRSFSKTERAMIRGVVEDLAGLLDRADSLASYDDPALRRLLPNAYPDDPDAAAEFASATRASLADGKAARARSVLARLDERETKLVFDRRGAVELLTVLGDARLALAERVGVDDLQADPWSHQGALYGWLTWLQGDLVEALS